MLRRRPSLAATVTGVDSLPHPPAIDTDMEGVITEWSDMNFGEGPTELSVGDEAVYEREGRIGVTPPAQATGVMVDMRAVGTSAGTLDVTVAVLSLDETRE